MFHGDLFYFTFRIIYDCIAVSIRQINKLYVPKI